MSVGILLRRHLTTACKGCINSLLELRTASLQTLTTSPNDLSMESLQPSEFVRVGAVG
jgi:hypothetical protein